MTPFYTILTNYGKTALAEALAAQQPLKIPHMAVGDGGGEYYEPTEAQTNLRNEQWRGELNDLRTDEELQGQVIAEAIIPHDIEGDWTAREIGLFDVKGGLIAVGKYPETYIPSAFSGAKNQVYINIIIKVDNVAAVQLIVDHGQVLASKQYVYEHGDAKLRADLKKESGANLISFKPNEVSEAVSLSVYDILHDGLTVKNFGAKGDWNAIDQIGSDDSAAFKKYAAYINTLQNPRKGGARIMRIPAGSYRLDGFKITQEIPYWSFNMIGEGQLTQLWFNPKGEGILLENENSRFINITLNGKLNPTYPSQEDPAIPYIVKAKLANKLFDVDLTCQGVDVMWYHCFAKVSGRGFVFESGSVGMGGGGGLCEIACDDDLMIAGDGGEAMHSIESVMRHFKVSNCRFDVNSRIFRITGKHPVKEYINGLTVSDCEITLGNSIVSSDDCRLVSPVFSGNFSIASFKSSNTTAVIDVPRAINVKDLNNTWNNYT
ncbi:MAG: phage tail protein, partial [Pseudomonadota bacterium]